MTFPDTSSPSVRALAHVAARSKPAAPPLDRGLRVTLNLHPDRRAVPGGQTVLESLAHDGVYRSQFETGTSNGGLTAHPGGDRWRWEQKIFGGAYDAAPGSARPRYGALDHPAGPGPGGAPRFGSAYLRLREAVLDRATFCFPDSALDPTAFATATHFDLWPLVDAWDARPLTDEVEAGPGGRLDGYVEAQVHGPVLLDDDVEALVLDPCWRGTPTARQADLLGVPVEWHEGRRLSVEELARHPAYRGPRTVEVGLRVARDGLLDARVLGQAVEAGVEDPQQLKRLWHHVARWGVAAEPG
ncbi:DUF3626 domain-containing protein [Nocardioides sp. AX2bis]|uniref:DUF3626 domain-containing protein n=1 Tax=Nocardioides sp. AX2bis TaxID=2653157 RepID=UPI0012F091C3|nr:DUF3626 domain-containing protein [Nocardioides sp. AX2bis]VXB92060.1 conserved hypothetical protein [Nocardioides sp. AX2bis]